MICRASLVVLLCCATVAVAQGEQAEIRPATDGYLLIEGVRSPDSPFRWDAELVPGRRCLVWPDGCLVLPDTIGVEEFGTDGILVPYSTGLRGIGAGGRLVFAAGTHPVSESLYMRDDALELFLADGVLEIRDGRLAYSRRPAAARFRRGQYLILAGVVLAVFLLLARARRRLRAA